MKLNIYYNANSYNNVILIKEAENVNQFAHFLLYANISLHRSSVLNVFRWGEKNEETIL